MVPGLHAVHELLSSRRRRVDQLWVARAASGRQALAEVVDVARRQKVKVVAVDDRALDERAGTTAHQGVLAWAAPLQPVALEALLRGPVPFLVVLDGVTDPGNFGAVLRSAACAGVTGVVIGRHRSAPLTPAAVKSAAGAVEHLPIAIASGVPSALAQVRRAGVWTVGLAPEADHDLWSTPVLDGPVALVLGSEGRGLAPLTRQRCDVLARIRQAGPIGSLNVAAAAAVACFEVSRRKAGSRRSDDKVTGLAVP